MKSAFNGININIFLLYLILSIVKVISLLDLTYPSAIGLSDGNIFIVEKKGIYVYDGQLKNIVSNYLFEEGEQINSLDILSNIIIKSKQFHIICLINRKIYLFDYEGKFLTKTANIIEGQYYYPSLTVLPFNEGNCYYYVVSYFIENGGNPKQKLTYNKINLYDKLNYNIRNLTMDRFETKTLGGWSSDSYDFRNKGLSCEYMQCENEDDKYLICFMIINRDSAYSLSLNYFSISTTSLSQNKDDYKAGFLDNINDVKQIQSVPHDNLKSSLVCLLYTNSKINCYKFHFVYSYLSDTVEFYSETQTNLNCKNALYSMKLNYLADGQNIVLSCINSESTVQAKFFNQDLNLKSSYTYTQFSQCQNIYGHSIVNYNSEYYIVSDVVCDNYKRCYEPLEGELSPIIIITTTQIIIETTFIEVKKEEEEIIEEKEEEKEKEKEILEEKMEEIIEEIIEEIEKEIEKEKYDEEIIEEILEKEKTINIQTTENIEPKYDCSSLEKCEECNQESLGQNLCIKCNQEKKYYYLNNYPSEPRKQYIDCVNSKTKPPKFYFNEINLSYEPCFSTCSSCEYGGNYLINNCSSCDGINYIKNPEDENSSNCVIKCRYLYYIEHNIYSCTEVPFCPEHFNYIIKNISKCTNNCKQEKEYKYLYNNECFKQCPNKTKDDDYICKDIISNECLLTESENNLINENINFTEIEKIVIKYINEFNYTNNHVSLYKNGDWTLTIYIQNKCILELNLGIPEINFDSCYEKIKSIDNSINNNYNLIIAILDKKIDNSNNKKVIKYGLYSSLTGKYLNSDIICKEEKITIVDSIENKLLATKVNIEVIKEFFNEGIDIFNMSSPFYNDICFQYNSKKDIALKDRVFEYFPNITLCEEGCDLKGINMTTITAICECFYSDSKREENLKEKVLNQAEIGALEEMISSSNIYVIKCINLVLDTKSLIKCYGGFVILGLFFIEIICTVIYCKKNIYSVNKYIFCITNKYINLLLEQKNNNNNKIIDKMDNKHNIKYKKVNSIQNANKNSNNVPPKQHERKSIDNTRPNIRKLPKKNKTTRKAEIKGNFKFIFNNNKEPQNNSNNFYNNNHNNKPNNIINSNNKIPVIYNLKNYEDKSISSDKELISSEQSKMPNISNALFININDNLDIDILEYLETQYDDMDYDDAIRKDKRKFCESYKDKLEDNQIIINTFCSYDPIRPRSIKIIFLIMQVDLYFVINGLFYDEEYISKIYHLEKDTFFTMAERFFDNLIYAALAGIIVNYIIEFFFIEEQKIKKIMKIEKENILVLKYEVIKILKSIKLRYLLFIIISFIISLIALVHIFCFNIVYYHTMVEWIAFSLIIILLIQLGSFLICLLQTTLRFISFKFKSEKLFKLSL